MQLFAIIAFVLYFIAPIKYSYEYCFIAQFVFLFNAGVLYYKDLKYEKIGFNAIFTISFFAMCYLFPVFVFQIDPDFSLFKFGYNSSVINKCTGLATLAYSLYAFGYNNSLKVKTTCIRKSNKLENIVNSNLIKKLLSLYILVFVVFLLCGGYSFFRSKFTHETNANTIANYLFQLIQVVIMLLVLCFYLEGDRRLKKISYLALGGGVLFFLIVGSRTLPLIVLITFFFLVVKKYKIGFLKVFCIAAVGALLMILIGFSRTSGNSEGMDAMSESYGTDLGVFGVMQDLLVNSYNYYVIYDYVSEKGIMWGDTLLGYILAIVPFAQNAYISLFHIPAYNLNSPSFVTHLIGANEGLGFGTNIVGDAYLAFGHIGVIISFYLLGYIVVYFRRKFELGDIWGVIIYLQLVGGAMYMVRSSMIGGLRTYIWSIAIMLIIMRSENRKITGKRNGQYFIDYS